MKDPVLRAKKVVLAIIVGVILLFVFIGNVQAGIGGVV